MKNDLLLQASNKSHVHRNSCATDRIRRGAIRLLAVITTVGVIGLAGCNGGSDNSSAVVRRAKPGPATNSSIFAVDCQTQRAYVPLPDLDADLHGQIAVLDLSVDPDVTNPVLTVIDIGLIALPRAAGVSLENGLVLATADNVLDTGALLLINESDNSLSAVSFPTGSRPTETSGVVVDPVNNTALISMSDSVNECTNGVGGCTGESVFNMGTRTFGPLILSLEDVDSFGLDFSTNLSIGSSDPITPELFAMNVPASETCVFSDDNVENLNKDPDAVAVDPTTHIWVVGNFESSLASVVNLNNSSFQGSGTIECHLVEAGTPPNSINHDTATGASGMPGVAINPITHQALMTAAAGPEIALLNLPKKPVTQLDASQVTSISSAIPNSPNGDIFQSAAFPYGTVIDSCHNFGYVVDAFGEFLVQVDLTLFKKHPELISTALPAGTCAGVTTSSQCDNGNGVKFFPLPQLATASASKIPPQFIDHANKRKKVSHAQN